MTTRIHAGWKYLVRCLKNYCMWVSSVFEAEVHL